MLLTVERFVVGAAPIEMVFAMNCSYGNGPELPAPVSVESRFCIHTLKPALTSGALGDTVNPMLSVT